MAETSKGRSKKHPVYLGVYVSQETADALRDLAERDDDEGERRSQQYLMRRAIRELLSKHGYKFGKSPKKGRA